MTIIKQDAPLIVDTGSNADTWCVYNHSVTMQEGEPPTVIMIGSCRLAEVYRLIEGRTNSEWSHIFKDGGYVLVTIVATTNDKREAVRHASDLMRNMKPIPLCNLQGYNLRGARRAIVCLNNGKRYRTQTEAAQDLGVYSSSISRHLRGELSHANGLRFAYAPDDRQVPVEKEKFI